MFALDEEPGSEGYKSEDKKTKSEIKKELEDSIANGGRNENTDIQEKVEKCTNEEDALKVIQEFEEIMKNKKSDTECLTY